MIYRKAIGLKIVKRALGISSVFWKTRKLSLWRGRPLLKRKMKLQIQQQLVMWEHWPLHELYIPHCWENAREKKILHDYVGKAMLGGSLVTTAWRVLRLRMEEIPSSFGG
jgi:hypothetical protein